MRHLSGFDEAARKASRLMGGPAPSGQLVRSASGPPPRRQGGFASCLAGYTLPGRVPGRLRLDWPSTSSTSSLAGCRTGALWARLQSFAPRRPPAHDEALKNGTNSRSARRNPSASNPQIPPDAAPADRSLTLMMACAGPHRGPHACFWQMKKSTDGD